MLCKYGCGNEGKFQLKSGSWICQDSYNNCPINREKNSIGGLKKAKLKPDVKCKYCGEYRFNWTIEKHEDLCYLNPKNIKLCLRCKKPIKDYKNCVTCSTNCSNKIFKHCGEDHWNYKNIEESHYRNICFKYHEHKCVICGEYIMLDVHHYDENPENSNKENLVPICATHHRYLHSKNKYIIKECIDEYVENFIKKYGALV